MPMVSKRGKGEQREKSEKILRHNGVKTTGGPAEESELSPPYEVVAVVETDGSEKGYIADHLGMLIKHRASSRVVLKRGGQTSD